MKLIDILVEELPKRGGWPECCYALVQGSSGVVYLAGGGMPLWKFHLAGDWELAEVTRGQYEAALAAIKQGWNGEGMPPIGSKVSFFYNERYDYHKEIIPEHGQELEVVAHKTTTDGHDVAVCYWDKSGGGMAVCLVPGSLLPIRSEADKKRDEVGEAIYRAINWNHEGTVEQNSRFEDYCKVYDAIAAGKVPGIRIE